MTLLNLLISSPWQGIVFLVAIVLAITVHEFAHAWTAARLGDDTPVLQGRVSLNPLAHLDPLGSLSFLIAGFGWGKPVIYNPMRLARRSYELMVALAGPLSNLLLAILLNLIAFLQAHSGAQLIQPLILTTAADLNVLLAAFNMLPLPPLDGSSIVAYFWPEYRSVVGGQIGLIILILLILPLFGGTPLIDVLITPVAGLFSAVTHLFGLI